MKKIALFLVLALVMSLVLVACGEEENSSEAVSEATSAEESIEESVEESEASEASEESAEESEVSEESEASESGDIETEEEKPFFISHYNDGSAEGAGVIFTETDAAGAWWHHIAFKPVKGYADVFEVVEVSIGTSGEGKVLAIPEGGFVYGVNVGNNWPQLIADGGCTGDGATGLWYDDQNHIELPNFASDNAQNAFALAGSFSAGQKYQIKGLDLENFEVPTSTPDKDWYDPEYVSTATIAKVK